MKIKIIYKRPVYSDVVLIYPNAEDIFKKYVFRNFSSQTLDVGTWFSFNPYVIAKTLKLALSIKLHFSLNTKNIFVRLLKDLYEKHLQAYIEIINPKYIITFIDDSAVFHRLSKNYRKDAAFIAIQNGMRPQSHFKYLLPKPPNPEAVSYIPNYFCHGHADVNSFKNGGHHIERYHPIGSLLGGIFWKEISVKSQKIYDICLVSCWVPEGRKDLNENAYEVYKADRKGNEVLEKNLKRLIDEKGYSVVIALKYDECSEEFNHFYNIFGDDVDYQLSSRKVFSTYKAIDKSLLTLTLYSTCAAEAIGFGKRALFCNGSGNPAIGIPSAGICYYEGGNYTEFSKRLENILEMPDNDFKKAMSKNISEIMNYDLYEMPHEYIHRFLIENK